MKRICFILMLAALVSCGKLGKDGRVQKELDWSSWYNDDTDTDDGKPSLMVMSFNVRLSTAAEDTGDKNWTNRRAGCYAMINTLRPVIMGTQECMKVQKDDLLANCPGYAAYGKSRDKNANGEEVAIFYLPDSVTVSQSGEFWLTDGLPTEPTIDPSAGTYRCATWVKFAHKKTNQVFYHINTHLDLAEVRAREMGFIMDWVDSHCGTLPVFLTADWNTSEDDPIFDYMYETFSNARWEAKTGDSHGTYNGFKNYVTSTKIDHIFYRGFPGCRRFTTVRQQWEGYRFISDHFPVYAVLKLQ